MDDLNSNSNYNPDNNMDANFSFPGEAGSSSTSPNHFLHNLQNLDPGIISSTRTVEQTFRTGNPTLFAGSLAGQLPSLGPSLGLGGSFHHAVPQPLISHGLLPANQVIATPVQSFQSGSQSGLGTANVSMVRQSQSSKPCSDLRGLQSPVDVHGSQTRQSPVEQQSSSLRQAQSSVEAPVPLNQSPVDHSNVRALTSSREQGGLGPLPSPVLVSQNGILPAVQGGTLPDQVTLRSPVEQHPSRRSLCPMQTLPSITSIAHQNSFPNSSSLVNLTSTQHPLIAGPAPPAYNTSTIHTLPLPQSVMSTGPSLCHDPRKQDKPANNNFSPAPPPAVPRQLAPGLLIANATAAFPTQEIPHIGSFSVVRSESSAQPREVNIAIASPQLLQNSGSSRLTGVPTTLVTTSTMLSLLQTVSSNISNGLAQAQPLPPQNNDLLGLPCEQHQHMPFLDPNNFPQPSSSGLKNEPTTFYHKATGKKVVVPPVTSRQEVVEANEAEPMPSMAEPSGLQSASLNRVAWFEPPESPMGAADSTTTMSPVNVSQFLNPPVRAAVRNAASSTMTGSRISTVTYNRRSHSEAEEAEPQVSSTSDGDEALNGSRNQHHRSPQVSEVLPDHLVTPSGISAIDSSHRNARSFHVGVGGGDSGQSDTAYDLPSSSGLVPPPEYEPISEDEEGEAEPKNVKAMSVINSKPRPDGMNNASVGAAASTAASHSVFPGDSAPSSLPRVHSGTHAIITCSKQAQSTDSPISSKPSSILSSLMKEDPLSLGSVSLQREPPTAGPSSLQDMTGINRIQPAMPAEEAGFCNSLASHPKVELETSMSSTSTSSGSNTVSQDQVLMAPSVSMSESAADSGFMLSGQPADSNSLLSPGLSSGMAGDLGDMDEDCDEDNDATLMYRLPVGDLAEEGNNTTTDNNVPFGLDNNNPPASELNAQSFTVNKGQQACKPGPKTKLGIRDEKGSFVDCIDVTVQIEDNQCEVVDGQKRWKCLQCPKVYTSKHNLVSHILGHNGIKPYCCSLCGKFFKQASHLYQHLLTHGGVKPHVCHICNRGFTQASHVKRHMAIHMDNRPHICDICDRGFIYPSELKAHKEKHANGRENSCDICGETFHTPKKLKQHMTMAHRNSEDLTCQDCGKSFSYPSQLRDHRMKHEGKRPFICGECGLDFMKEHHLKAHQFTHTGLKPFTCQVCSRAFNQKANLQRHLMIHEGRKNHKCEVCGRTFTQPQVLKAHMVTHSDEKPHTCNQCGKKFSRLHNLNGHMHMHRGQKPHMCFCGASFTLKGNLNRHKKVKHDLADGVDCTDEEAAKILNEMSSSKAKPAESDTEGSSSSNVPKKKRKSQPPRKRLAQVAEDVEVETLWNQAEERANAMTKTEMEPQNLDLLVNLVGPQGLQTSPVQKEDGKDGGVISLQDMGSLGSVITNRFLGVAQNNMISQVGVNVETQLPDVVIMQKAAPVFPENNIIDTTHSERVGHAVSLAEAENSKLNPMKDEQGSEIHKDDPGCPPQSAQMLAPGNNPDCVSSSEVNDLQHGLSQYDYNESDPDWGQTVTQTRRRGRGTKRGRGTGRATGRKSKIPNTHAGENQ